jgi:hypothetical protein
VQKRRPVPFDRNFSFFAPSKYIPPGTIFDEIPHYISFSEVVNIARYFSLYFTFCPTKKLVLALIDLTL